MEMLENSHLAEKPNKRIRSYCVITEARPSLWFRDNHIKTEF